MESLLFILLILLKVISGIYVLLVSLALGMVLVGRENYDFSNLCKTRITVVLALYVVAILFLAGVI